MKSMTGFGAATALVQGQMLRLELSGINRKQLEVSLNMPRSWAELEAPLRRCVSEQVSRGRVQLSISQERGTENAAKLQLNEEKLAALQALLPRLQEQLGCDPTITLAELLRLDIIEDSADSSVDSPAAEKLPELEALLRAALTAFLAMKSEEGANLKRDLLARVATIRTLAQELATGAAGAAQRYRELLLARLEESGLPVSLALDDERIVKEVALFADRCDISEELTRLDSHLDQFCLICEKDEPVGRPLDFLCQEIFRELNTTGSKVNNASLAQVIVTAKTELEKIREQVQNVE